MDEQRFKHYIALLKKEFPDAPYDFIYKKAMEMHDKYIESITYNPNKRTRYDEIAEEASRIIDL